MPNTTIAPAGDATFIVPMIRLRDGSVGCTQMAGSSGSLVSAAVAYSASTCSAFDSGEGAGGGFVESSSGAARLRVQPSDVGQDGDAQCQPPVERQPNLGSSVS